MERISKMWRSGLALVLAICMVIGVIPATAFAAEEEINYVSIGDSMTNGYCFTGYDQGNSANILTGAGMYGNDAYPNLFADWLEETTGKNVNHSKLAVSAMRAEDLNYLLGGREMPTDGWFGQVEHYSGADAAELVEIYQEAITEADVITMGIGNAAFGAYMVQYFTRMIGVMGGSLDEDEKVDLDKALEILEPAQQEVIKSAYDKMMAKVAGYIPEELGPIADVQGLIDMMSYIGVGFLLNYEGALDQIVALNPDVEVVLLGLMNTTYGMEITGEGFDPIAIGDIVGILFDALNTYIAALPTVKQATGEWADAKFYYADMSNPEFIVQVFDDLYEEGWPADFNGLSGETVRDRTIKAYNDSLRGMIGLALGFNLPKVDITDVEKYLLTNDYQAAIMSGELAPKWQEEISRMSPEEQAAYGAGYEWAGSLASYIGYGTNKQISIAIYVALEEALAESVDTMEITLDGLMGIAVDPMKALGDVPDALDPKNGPGPLTIKNALVEWFTGSDTALAMCKVFAMFKVGDGMSVHPTPAAHEKFAANVIAAYGEHTAKDETEKHLKYVLGELKGFLEEYAPNVASQAYDLWIKNGYQEKVDECIAELIALLDARKANYTDVVLPALNDTIAALSAQKDALSAELTVLKAQLEAKKAELEAVLAEQTIPGVSAPDLSIDVELGNNQPTTVPGNDCPGAGYTADELAAAIADLEHAIAVTEALIADITADINDMIALAEEIAESVESLIKTLADIAAAAQALKEAVVAVANVLTDDSAKAATETFINAFNTAREAALTAADALGLLLETVKGDAAAIEAAAAVLENGTLELCQKLAGDKDQLVDILINNISTDKLLIAAVSLDLIKTVLEENEDGIKAAIEAKKAELKAELEDALKALEAEYAPQIEAKKAELEAKKAELEAKKAELEPQLKAEFEAKYAELTAKAEAEIAALEAAAAEKLAALEAELAAKQAELAALAEDAAEEVRAGIQAQIDRITGDIATINADLLCATEHVNTALKAAYDALVAEVTALYNQAVAELENAYNQAIAELENAYNNLVAEYEAAVKALKDAYNAAVKELEDAFNTTISGIIENVKGQVSAAIENVKQTLIDLGVNSVESLVNAITTLVQEILHQATHADLALGGTSTYVALGDGSTEAEGYVELLAERLQAQYGIQGYTNYAAAGNTVASVKANLGSYADLADADLITVGFSNVSMLNNAIANALEETPVAYDWTKLVGKELAPYVEEALAEVYAEIAAIDLGAEITEMLNIAIEGIAYGALEYAIELPQLIAAIREVNADAVIVILGQYDPMDGAVLKFDDVSVDVSEYIGYFVDGVTAHGIAYCVLTGEAIFVEAPAVATANTDKELTFVDLMRLAKDDFAPMYPSTTGDTYITNQILEALNISKIPVALWGDADSNGIVNLRDAILILQAANGKDVAIDSNASDVTADGQVNLQDAIYVLKRVNGHADLFPAER